MLDRLDQLLWFLQRHWRAVLASTAAVVLGTVLLKGLGGGSEDTEAPLPQNAVAAVGDRMITRDSMDRWKAIYAAAGAAAEGGDADDAVLQGLIASVWTEQEASRLDVEVTDAQIDEAVQGYVTDAQEQGVTKKQMLEQFGGTEADFRWQLKVSLLTSALQTRVAEGVEAPTDEAIESRYQQDGARWANPSVRDARLLSTADEQAASKAAAALRRGRSWSWVAKRHGNSEVSQATARIRNARPGRREAAFERALFAARVGEISDPLQFSWGWTILKVEASDPLSAIPLSQARKRIRGELRNEAQSEAVAEYLEDFRGRWKAQTRCAADLRDTTVCNA